VLDYDHEAGRYDDSRGGEKRAAEAAAAVHRLLPARPGLVVDVGGGTGIVSAVLAKLGHDVAVCDLSHGMLRAAQNRLPGRVLRADARRLPFPDSSLGAVCMVWLLHLVEHARDVERMLVEVVRVLAPGGRLVTTVDKAAAHGHHSRAPGDASAAVDAVLRRLGMRSVASTTFVGIGQGGGRSDPVFTLRAFERPDADG